MSAERAKRPHDAQARFVRGHAPRRPARPGPRRSAPEEPTLPPAAPAVDPGNTEKPPKPPRPFPWGLFALAVLLLLAAGLYRDLNAARDADRLLDQRTEPVFVTVRYLVPNRPDETVTVAVGESVALHPPVELPGYTFLGWERPDGSSETRAAFPVYADTFLTARYALTFETEKHLPYLFADADGVVDVNAEVSVREAVSTLYRLLDIDLVGSGEFLDVPEDDSCRKAAATLKDLRVLDGSFLYPDDSVTRCELLRMLCCFYPASDAPVVFRDLNPEDEYYPIFRTAADRGWIDSGPDCDADPSGTLCRGELARILNRVLGRSPAQAPPATAVGMILDVPPSNPWYADVAEALIPHEYVTEDGRERWTASAPLPVHEPGLFFAGVRLHYISPAGVPAVNCVVGGRRYNASGEMTSGDAALDRLLWDYLAETVDPLTMSHGEMLRAVYNRLWQDYAWQEGWVYDLGDTDWVISEATQMLREKHGNSYGYAAVFYELARFLGYEPALISGMIYGTQEAFESPDGRRIEVHAGYMPHAWVEITEMATPFIYDPERDARSAGKRMMFGRTGEVRWQTGYRTQ